jgi:hypothetical protein
VQCSFVDFVLYINIEFKSNAHIKYFKEVIVNHVFYQKVQQWLLMDVFINNQVLEEVGC